MSQLDLFAQAHRERMTRRDDPATSKAAADSLTDEALNRMERLVLEALACYPDFGATRWNLTATVRTLPGDDLEVSSVSRRLTSLVRKGLACDTGLTRSGPSGRSCTVFLITDKGREALT